MTNCPHLTAGICDRCYVYMSPAERPVSPPVQCGCRCGFPHAPESQAVQLVAAWPDVLNAHAELVKRADDWQAKYEKAEADRRAVLIAVAAATGRTFIPPERNTDADVVIDAVRATREEREKAEAACAAMRGPLQAIADNARVLADDCHWHHGGAGCNGECIWSGVKRALATDAGTALLARLKEAEQALQTADEVHAYDRNCMAQVTMERDAARAERDALLKTTEARIAAAERLYNAAGRAAAFALHNDTERPLREALDAYEQTRAVRP